MSREKQTEIQQFVIDLQNVSQKASKIITDETAKYVKENHKYNNIIDYAKAHIKSRFEYEAEFLTELGYAKASEVALEVIDEIEQNFEIGYGGVLEFKKFLAELKKKYTE
jgi:hypothetical protein